PEPAVAARDSAGPIAGGFRVAARASGFLTTDRFNSFLQEAEGKDGRSSDAFAGLGMTATLCLILLGGLALNLTPCVLPVIPINLAVLGAGTNPQNRRR